MDKEDKILRKKISSLDKISPPVGWTEDQLWAQIEQSEEKFSPQIRWAVAATIAVLLAVGSYFFIIDNQQSAQLSYSSEIIDPITILPATLDESDSEALAFIKAECLHLSEVCKSPEFQFLSDELVALETEMVQIDEMIQKYGEDPAFIASKAEVADLMSEITNQLIQMVLS